MSHLVSTTVLLFSQILHINSIGVNVKSFLSLLFVSGEVWTLNLTTFRWQRQIHLETANAAAFPAAGRRVSQSSAVCRSNKTLYAFGGVSRSRETGQPVSFMHTWHPYEPPGEILSVDLSTFRSSHTTTTCSSWPWRPSRPQFTRCPIWPRWPQRFSEKITTLSWTMMKQRKKSISSRQPKVGAKWTRNQMIHLSPQQNPFSTGNRFLQMIKDDFCTRLSATRPPTVLIIRSRGELTGSSTYSTSDLITFVKSEIFNTLKNGIIPYKTGPKNYWWLRKMISYRDWLCLFKFFHFYLKMQ